MQQEKTWIFPFDLPAYVEETLKRYLHTFPSEESRFSLLKTQLQNAENLGTRKNFNGHMTASAYLLSEGKCLMIHHIALDKRLAPWGHWEEGDGELFHTAQRELIEETGLQNVALHNWHKEHHGIPLDIDTHAIPYSEKKQEPAHFHHDFRFVFVLTGEQKLTLQREEVADFGRKAYDTLPEDASSLLIKKKLLQIKELLKY